MVAFQAASGDPKKCTKPMGRQNKCALPNRIIFVLFALSNFAGDL